MPVARLGLPPRALHTRMDTVGCSAGCWAQPALAFDTLGFHQDHARHTDALGLARGVPAKLDLDPAFDAEAGEIVLEWTRRVRRNTDEEIAFLGLGFVYDFDVGHFGSPLRSCMTHDR